MDVADSNPSSPLDLSVKSRPSEAPSAVSEGISVIPTNRLPLITLSDDDRRKVALSEILDLHKDMPHDLNMYSEHLRNFTGGGHPVVHPLYENLVPPCDWTSLPGLSLPFPLLGNPGALSQLWRSGMPGMSSRYLPPPTAASAPLTEVQPCSPYEEIVTKRPLLPFSGGMPNFSFTTPSDVYGISIRGNQKYSAYYQKPFAVPFGKKNVVSEDIRPKPEREINVEKEDTTATTERPGPSKAKETAFICTCGEEFENLYIFTLHMKESNHKPRTSQPDRDIPKLVRGQDMWINSETEQTREILRCMRCHQSFRSLPELTMHMIKTNHYSEIVYSDSGRCVFVNSEDKRAEKRSSVGGSSVSKDFGKHPLGKTATDYPQKKMMKLEKPKESSGICQSGARVTVQSSSESPFKKPAKPEIIEADSATASDVVGESRNENSHLARDSPTSKSSSVIQQIESFVEKSLPKCNTVSLHSKIHSQLRSESTYPQSEQRYSLKTGMESSRPPYLAPIDVDSQPGENPLSSLQKLVDTTKVETSPGSCGKSGSDNVGGDSTASGISGSRRVIPPLPFHQNSGTPSPFIPPSPTVIMLNPTYIYQPAFPPLHQLYSYHWYSGLGGLYDANGQAAAAAAVANSAASPPNSATHSAKESPNISAALAKSREPISPGIKSEDVTSVVDLSQGHNFSDDIDVLKDCSNSDQNGGTTTSEGILAKAMSNSRDSRLSLSASVSTTSMAITKKTKCNFCGKPFANKGQVRLHVSKGKCPSLLQSCHSKLNSLPFGYRRPPMSFLHRAAPSSADAIRNFFAVAKASKGGHPS